MKQENCGMRNHWNIVEKKKNNGKRDTEKTGVVKQKAKSPTSVGFFA